MQGAPEPSQLYVILDTAQDRRLPECITGHAQAQAHPLLEEINAHGKTRAMPYLLRLPNEISQSLAQALEETAGNPAALVLLASRAGEAETLAHLRAITDVMLPDRSAMILAYWDPVILATLLGNPADELLVINKGVLKPGQRGELCGPVCDWWYWDPNGRLHHMHGSSDAHGTTKPLVLDQDQVDQLVEANLPHQMLYYLNLNQPGLLMEVQEKERYPLVKRITHKAREWKLEVMQDLVNYVSVARLLGEGFDQKPDIHAMMQQVKSGSMKFDQVLDVLEAQGY